MIAKKLNFIKIYLKNNIRDFYFVYVVLISISSSIFILISYFINEYDFSKPANYQPNDSYIIVGIIFLILSLMSLLFVYIYNFKQNLEKLKLYNLLGIKKSDILLAVFIEIILLIIPIILFGMFFALILTKVAFMNLPDADYWSTYSTEFYFNFISKGCIITCIMQLIFAIITLFVNSKNIKTKYGKESIL